MNRDGQQHRQVFRGTRADKWVYRGMGPGLSLLIVPGLINPGSGGNGVRVMVGTLIVLALAFTWRGWRLGTVEISCAGLTAYGAVRRWHWEWSDLDHVEVDTSPLAFSGNRPLVVCPSHGDVVRLTSVVDKARTPGKSSWVAAAADAINDGIRSEREHPDSTGG